MARDGQARLILGDVVGVHNILQPFCKVVRFDYTKSAQCIELDDHIDKAFFGL